MLNAKQKEAFDRAVLTKENLFISGEGGKGKSYLSREIIAAKEGSIIVAAPTGISALNIGGGTMNSMFKLPLHILTEKDETPNDKIIQLFGTDSPVKTILLDEIGNTRSDKFRTIDYKLRKARRLNKPFGGLQVITVGDFYQLPPVIGKNEKSAFREVYKSPYAFSTDSWAACDFGYIELEENMRTSDETFRRHLSAIRKKDANYRDSVDYFNEVGSANLERLLEEDPTFLCTINKSADAINIANFNELDAPIRTYRGRISGNFDRSMIAVPEELQVKEGMRVIICANSSSYKNGQTGYVLKAYDTSIVVLIEDTEEEVVVSKARWVQNDYVVSNGKLEVVEVGSYEQFPLKLGYGISIHKSQGATLTRAVLNFGSGCFEYGQAYVGLSRLKSPSGLGIMGHLSYSDVMVDPIIHEFYDNGCRGIGL